MVTIPCGCTPYPQAGDIGIFCELKDKLSDLINTQQHSDQVEYNTRCENPKPQSLTTFDNRFNEAWCDVNETNIICSVQSAGFYNDYKQWSSSQSMMYMEKSFK